MGILFKYMSSPWNLFEDGFIRASQISVLNDPFEAIYCQKSLDDLVSYFDISESNFSNYITQNINNVGVISFTESKDNLLMWAHYANEHKGLVVGFNTYGKILLNLIKPVSSTSFEKHTPFNGEAKPVMYRKQPRYRVDKFDFDYSNISVEGEDRVLYEIFLQKSNEWVYEQEHRIVLRLEQADKVRIFDLDKIENEGIRNFILKSKHCCFIKEKQSYHEISLMDFEDHTDRAIAAESLAGLSKNKENIYLFKLSPRSISYCIFGAKCSLSIKDIKKSFLNSSSNFEVWKATQNKMNYSIDFEQLHGRNW